MPEPRIFCSSCHQLAQAGRLDWNDLTEERAWNGGDDLGMGPYHWKAEPVIQYYRRVRRCSNCDQLIHTAELSESCVGELAALREEAQALREKLQLAIERVSELAEGLQS